MKLFRDRRPRIGCVALSVLFVPGASCVIGLFLSMIPAPSGMPEDAVLATVASERALVERRGFAIAETKDSTADAAGVDRWTHTLAAGRCLAAIAGVAGFQAPVRLTISEASGAKLVEYVPTGFASRVAHAQWCTDDDQEIAIELERRAVDVFEREGHTAASVHFEVLEADAARAGGLPAVDRGRPTSRAMERAGRRHMLDAADRLRTPNARALVPDLDVNSFEARLLPEDPLTYAELHRGAQNGTSDVVNPRFTPLPSAIDPTFVPAGIPERTMEALRHAVRPNESPTAAHPAVRRGESGMERVLAIIDARRLGVACASVQLVRMRYMSRPAVHRYAEGETDEREVRTEENVALDRLCRADRMVVYTTPAVDQDRYTLRIDEAR